MTVDRVLATPQSSQMTCKQNGRSTTDNVKEKSASKKLFFFNKVKFYQGSRNLLCVGEIVQCSNSFSHELKSTLIS